MSPESASTTRSTRSIWLLATVAIVLSIALHVVPQLLRDSYDPAWSMLVLILYAPFEWWSLFVNVLMWPLVGMMFAVEWMVRRFAFKELPPHTPLHIVARIVAYQRQVGQMRAARRTG